ncbi:hypothetical protein LCGC14_0338260 [marine sediment metagenome]|uniref:Uncharacterized protein n=1 Tax=marine sediment metagenome TaxID=412755 RepID=A0A0F9TXD6_9ZZZZ
MSKEECPHCNELAFVPLRTILVSGGYGDIDLWECQNCKHEEAALVIWADWGITEETALRISRALKVAVDKYEHGMIERRKASGIYPCCDALHEFDSGLGRLHIKP